VPDPSPTVRELVERFEGVPAPVPGDVVDLGAARAVADWLTHPYVCSGGKMSDEYVPPYLRALIAEVDRLRMAMQSLDHKMERYGEHGDDCPGSHPAYCTCEVGNWRRAIRHALKPAT
jgi:hypothetical protein